jgi:hypothetical protein
LSWAILCHPPSGVLIQRLQYFLNRYKRLLSSVLSSNQVGGEDD